MDILEVEMTQKPEIEEVMGLRPRWVCPYCGKVQERTEKIYADEDFTYRRCPNCRTEVNLKDIKHGIFEWLEQIRRTDPQTYSKFLSLMLDPVWSNLLTDRCYW
jgi:endogenous inhibitor of DNA gyrase (YacG/DUF329 family)